MAPRLTILSLMPIFGLTLLLSRASASEITVFNTTKIVQQTIQINLKQRCYSGFETQPGSVLTCKITNESLGLPITGKVLPSTPARFDLDEKKWLEVTVSEAQGSSFIVSFMPKTLTLRNGNEIIKRASLSGEEWLHAHELLTSALERDFKIPAEYQGPELK
jgi:hypothetical protein